MHFVQEYIDYSKIKAENDLNGIIDYIAILLKTQLNLLFHFTNK